MKEESTYTGRSTAQISFPLGGIGSGCIGLAGNGQLIDWEIRNRPNKKSYHNYSGFLIRAYDGDRLVSARVLAGDLMPPYTGEARRGEPRHSGYGFGPSEKSFAGFPHFSSCAFIGEFPIAEIRLEDEGFPGKVAMKAWNPFIPLNDKDSSIPAALFEISVENTGETELEYTICLVAGAPFCRRDSMTTSEVQLLENGKKMRYVKMGTDTIGEDDADYGDITLATDAEDTSVQCHWYRGGWQDGIEMFWHDFTHRKRLPERRYGKEDSASLDDASLASYALVLPGRVQGMRFGIFWNFPNVRNTWSESADGKTWKNYYATLFADSVDAAGYVFHDWDRLWERTEAFRRSLFASTVDREILEAVSSNLSVLKTPTCLRLEDGTFYGFEGCREDEGCCEGSCTHVWNYAYALPYLFPALERSMRDADFRYNQREDGRMSFRIVLPLGSGRQEFRACVDGQMGGVIKTYRDWRISGDTQWLKGNWEAVKRSISYAWAESNEDKWDPHKEGVISGRQHNTLDMELFGPNSWMNGFYLAALKAGAIMAHALGDEEAEGCYRELFRKGKEFTDRELFDGEYYVQKVDLEDRGLLEQFQGQDDYEGFFRTYWNEEAGQMKYQIGDGCSIDQLTAQWHANLCGLGEIFDPDQAKTALGNLFRNNFRKMRDVANAWRVFSLNDEEGMIMCSWPEGKERPAVPITYNTETMTGFEYQAASQMIQNGMYEEGLRIVRAVRERYDGEKRNPWNEMECGSNYARSMASYSLLLSWSGISYDGIGRKLRIMPVQPVEEGFVSFYCTGSAWGTVSYGRDGWKVKVCGGKLRLRELEAGGQAIQKAVLEGADIPFDRKDGIVFEKEIVVAEDQTIAFLV